MLQQPNRIRIGRLSKLLRDTEDRFLIFFAHFTSFLPILLILALGLMFGIRQSALLRFWLFASATVSLEVCFGVLRAKYTTVAKYGNLAINARNHDDRVKYKQKMRDAIRM